MSFPSWAFRSIEWAMILVLAIVLTSGGRAAAYITPEQKACCAAMSQHCGDMAFTTSCCTGQAQADDGRQPQARVELSGLSPSPALLTILDLPERAHACLIASIPAGTASASPPGTKTYLAVSSFRL